MAMDFLAPSRPAVQKSQDAPWKILIVDDDPEVHDVTRIAVAGCLFEGREFELLHALSAQEARAILREQDDIAVALVDVVMESDTAGLGLVSWIRSELDNHFTRLILRTGQPGYAPQTDVIMKFDIDGYAEKAELSRTKLITAIVTALRGYKLVMSLDRKRRKLKQLNTHFTRIMEKNATRDFAGAVLTHFAELAGQPVDSFLCGLDAPHEQGEPDSSALRVLAAAGSFEDKVDLPVEVLSDDTVWTSVSQCIERKATCATQRGVALPLVTRSGVTGALYLGLSEDRLEDLVGSEVVQLFVSNVALGYEKTGLLDHIRNLAYVDKVTGLSSYTGFLEAFQRHSAKYNPLLVVHLDIQRFRVIVDGIGDEKAGGVLRKTGHRLSRTFPDALAIARKEKDEFLILFGGKAEDSIADIVSRVDDAFQDPIALDDNQILVRIRLGFALADDEPSEAEQLVRHASIALNDVRQNKLTKHSVFQPRMQDAALERLRLASLLTNAASQTQFSLHYQPIMHARNEEVASMEALMRFHTPSGEQLNTARMIEAAEASGLIAEIGAWMFKTAFTEFSQMPGLGEDVRLNINLSPLQMQASRIYRDIEDAASAAQVPLNRLVFEVTEGLFINNDQVTLSLMSWLQDKGASVVIDDFGTGYSSFGYLRKLPVDGIKIDRSFIMNMDQDADALAVTKSIIAVAQAMGLSVTAEGVETPAQCRIMQDLGCDYLQGFLYSRPVDREGLDAFVRNVSRKAG